MSTDPQTSTPGQKDPSQPRPFRIDIPDEEVARMVRLITDTRLPDEPHVEGASWDYGADLDWLKSMRQAWITNFNWKDVERQMNELQHFKVSIESVDLHFVHHKSERADAVPIILTHGWPGSFWEFHKTIPLLTSPPADQPAFHVVVPSLPGFGFSSAPPKKYWTMQDNARMLDHLMTGVLGYPAYMAQGGDWGSVVTTSLGTAAYPACKLVNLNMCGAPPTLGAKLTLPLFLLPTSWRNWVYGKIYDDVERGDLAHAWEFVKRGSGYYLQQATRPLTIGYALYDSPVGQLAWMGEKYREHMDPALVGDLTRDVLATVSVYFLTRTFPTSALPYRENLRAQREAVAMTKPYGLSRFTHDVFIMPVSWVRAVHPELVFLRRHERGGHFPGLEVPELLVGDLREMVASRKELFISAAA